MYGLSKTQQNVLDLASAGYGPSDIARELGISTATARVRLCEARKLAGIKAGLEKPATLDELDVIANQVWERMRDDSYYQPRYSEKKSHYGLAFLQNV